MCKTENRPGTSGARREDDLGLLEADAHQPIDETRASRSAATPLDGQSEYDERESQSCQEPCQTNEGRWLAFLRGERVPTPDLKLVLRAFDHLAKSNRVWILSRFPALDPADVDQLIEAARSGHERASLPRYLHTSLFFAGSGRTILGRRVISALRRLATRQGALERYRAAHSCDDRPATAEERADIAGRAVALLPLVLCRLTAPGARALATTMLSPLFGAEARTEASVASEYRWTPERLGNTRSKVLIAIRAAARELDG